MSEDHSKSIRESRDFPHAGLPNSVVDHPPHLAGNTKGAREAGTAPDSTPHDRPLDDQRGDAPPDAIEEWADESRLKRRIEFALESKPFEFGKGSLRLAWADHRISGPAGLIVVPEKVSYKEIWFVGDMHGDLLGFEAALCYLDEVGDPNRTVVFLGDVIDDGLYSFELIRRLLQVLEQNGDGFLFVPGNHDVSLGFRDGKYVSRVDPGDFSGWLNSKDAAKYEEEHVNSVVHAFVHLVENSPRALFLPGGLFAAHAGFPHSDLYPSLDTPESMAKAECLQDFVWNRWSDSALKLPNRSSLGCQFGAKDFRGFCEKASGILKTRIRSMVRGHDHVFERHRWERKEDVPRDSYHGRILTINNMSFTLPRERVGLEPPEPRFPTLARYRVGDEFPRPVVLKISPELLDWYAPCCEKCGLRNDKRNSICTMPAHNGSGVCGGRVSNSVE